MAVSSPGRKGVACKKTAGEREGALKGERGPQRGPFAYQRLVLRARSGDVRGEHAENAIRKDFLPSEIDSIRRATEPLEKKAAKEHQRHGGRGKKGAKVSQPFRAVDKIGAFAGVSGPRTARMPFTN